MGVGLVTASERIYLGVKLLKDVYNQFECEIRSHSVLELTIYKSSTHFMSLFALVVSKKVRIFALANKRLCSNFVSHFPNIYYLK